MRALRFAIAVGIALAAGCKAQPKGTSDDGGADFAVAAVADLAAPDLAPPAPPPDLAICTLGPELCSDGCDNDGNGYVDGDDPACTTQLLVTVRLGAANLSRLVLGATPKLVPLDGNPVPGEAFAVHNRAFSPAAYIALAGSTKQLSVRPLDGGVNDVSLPYAARDVCVFNGELLVVEFNQSRIHRYPPGGPSANGANEIMPPITAVASYIDACASDGNVLFVSRHDTTAGAVGQFVVLDQSRAVVGNPIALPAGLPAGFDRCLDFAFTKHDHIFVGLFAKSGGAPDSTLDGQLMAPFGFDGGLGPAIDAGIWHGLGEFLP